MPEMSGKGKSNPTKTNSLIYIIIFSRGGGVKKFKIFTPPPPHRVLKVIN